MVKRKYARKVTPPAGNGVESLVIWDGEKFVRQLVRKEDIPGEIEFPAAEKRPVYLDLTLDAEGNVVYEEG